MAEGKFATAINCMDGRVQEPVILWFKIKHGYDYVDMVTEPGPILAMSEGDEEVIESIKKRTMLSVECHESDVVAVIGHYDCTGNPQPKEVQLLQIERSMEVVRSWGISARVIGLWVNDRWETELVFE